MTRRLAELGVRVGIGHEGSHVAGADLVVYSSAIRPDNPEIVAARQMGIPVCRRAEYLCELMRQKTVITVSGAHGKTTTSSLAATLLVRSDFRPTVAVGGILRDDGDNVKLGESAYFVAEADESDGSFLCYQPTYSLITNVDYEHMDYYKTFDHLKEAYGRFIAQTRPEGCVIYCQEDPVLRSLVDSGGVRSLSYGWDAGADFSAVDVRLSEQGLSFSCARAGGNLGQISSRLLGRHNVLNILAVVALATELGIPFESVREAVAAFAGVERRFQTKLRRDDVWVVDDYAHHPTEIAATLAAARSCRPGRLLAVFQPHRYTRTHLLMERFAPSFSSCDLAVVTDIYAAGEDAIEDVTAEGVARRMADFGIPTRYVPKAQLVKVLADVIQPRDMVMMMGAGDITRLSDELTTVLEKKSFGK
jgi:UDP-N-acetylmuramate--alanine ligase